MISFSQNEFGFEHFSIDLTRNPQLRDDNADTGSIKSRQVQDFIQLF